MACGCSFLCSIDGFEVLINQGSQEKLELEVDENLLELIKTEADIRKKRQAMIYAQEERRRQVIEYCAIVFLVLVITGSLIGIVYLYVLQRGY